MKFHITKLHIWFEQGQPQRIIEFQNNKVNVITGSSSTGKSNVLAIIDYCLCSTQPRIVYPVINEYAKWYGLEFVANGKTYAIARKKPTEETAESNVYRQYETFPTDFYPQTSNVQISDLRKELDSLWGLKEVYRNPHIEGIIDSRVSFRSFLIYNALTESIVTSPHFFTDYNFFDSIYVGSQKQRDYLMYVLLGLDNVEANKVNKKLLSLKDLKSKIDKDNRKIVKFEKLFNEQRKEAQRLLGEYLPAIDESETFSFQDWITYFEDFFQKNVPEETDDKELIDLRNKLNRLIVLRDNILDARKEIRNYLSSEDELIKCLKPVEYLKCKERELGSSYWTQKIIKTFEESLNGELNTKRTFDNIDILYDDRYKKLQEEIEETRESIASLSNKAELTENKRQDFFYRIGCLKSLIEQMKDIKQKSSKLSYHTFTAEEEAEMDNLNNKIKNFTDSRNNAIHNLNSIFQEIYDTFNYMEYYQGCNISYSFEDERLTLNRKQAYYREENIGSQSNYMFLHLCFFLGIHKYMLQYKNPFISQFLFIDQLSIPYYAGSDKVKTTDEDKLIDAFKAINRFMDYAINQNNEEFQIILMEHAPERYWIDENTGKALNDLEYFVTIEKFIDDNALVPINIIEQNNKD